MSGANNHTNFEVLAGMNSDAGRRSWCITNDVAPTSGRGSARWGSATDGFLALPQDHGSMNRRIYGNLECVMTLPSGFVEPWWRNSSGWHLSKPVGDEGEPAKGPTTLIQATSETLAHSCRHNGNGGGKWLRAEALGRGSYLSSLKSNIYESFEVVAGSIPAEMPHYRREAFGGDWAFTQTIAPDDAAGCRSGSLAAGRPVSGGGNGGAGELGSWVLECSVTPVWNEVMAGDVGHR